MVFRRWSYKKLFNNHEKVAKNQKTFEILFLTMLTKIHREIKYGSSTWIQWLYSKWATSRCAKLSLSNHRYFGKDWYKYTNNTYILDIVTNGPKLELNELPCQCSRSTDLFLAKANEVISAKIMKMLMKKVTVHSTYEFTSGIFTRNKKMEVKEWY